MPGLMEMPDSGTTSVNGNRCFFMPMPINTTIIDDCNSTSNTAALAANQGRVLKENMVDTYSQTETKTNKVWIDGKTIYRKVLVKTRNSSTTFAKGWQTIEFSEMPVLTAVTDMTLMYNSSGTTPVAVYEEPYGVLPGALNLYASNTFGYKDLFLILEYTKD